MRAAMTSTARGTAQGVSTVLVYSTIGTEEEAKNLARALLSERLVACVNLLPLQSLYHWEDTVEEGPEIGLFLKTDETRLADLLDRLPELHPYDVPCVEVLPLSAVHPPYAEWVRAETKG